MHVSGHVCVCVCTCMYAYVREISICVCERECIYVYGYVCVCSPKCKPEALSQGTMSVALLFGTLFGDAYSIHFISVSDPHIFN